MPMSFCGPAFGRRARCGFPHRHQRVVRDAVSLHFSFGHAFNEKAPAFAEAFYCDPAGARTQDPDIKSVVLYQLSYRIFQHSLPP